MGNRKKSSTCAGMHAHACTREDDLFEGYFEDVAVEFTPEQARQWQKQAQIYAEQFKLNIQIIEDEITQKNAKKCKI